MTLLVIECYNYPLSQLIVVSLSPETNVGLYLFYHSLDAVKALAGDKFDQAKFDELKDENGYVTKEALLGLARKGRYSFRTFTPATAKGGASIDPSKTAILCIEFQNEFATEGGKLNDAVAPVMASTGMLDKTVDICAAARSAGAKVFHEAITFAEDASDNPNKGLGILAGCAGDKLFTAGTWNAEFCDKMQPQEGDVVVMGKKGLDGFPDTDLEEKLIDNQIEVGYAKTVYISFTRSIIHRLHKSSDRFHAFCLPLLYKSLATHNTHCASLHLPRIFIPSRPLLSQAF